MLARGRTGAWGKMNFKVGKEVKIVRPSLVYQLSICFGFLVRVVCLAGCVFFRVGARVVMEMVVGVGLTYAGRG